jgi:hypothetical protein
VSTLSEKAHREPGVVHLEEVPVRGGGVEISAAIYYNGNYYSSCRRLSWAESVGRAGKQLRWSADCSLHEELDRYSDKEDAQ